MGAYHVVSYLFSTELVFIFLHPFSYFVLAFRPCFVVKKKHAAPRRGK